MSILFKILIENINSYQKNGSIKSTDIVRDKEHIRLYNHYSFYSDFFTICESGIEVDYCNISKLSCQSDVLYIELKDSKLIKIASSYFEIIYDLLKEIVESKKQFYVALKTWDTLDDNSFIDQNNIDQIIEDKYVKRKWEIVTLIETKQFLMAESKLKGLLGYSTTDILYFSGLLKRNQAKYDNKPKLYYEALQQLFQAHNNNKSNRFLFNVLKNTYLEYKDVFFDIPLAYRKFIFITDGFYGFPNTGFCVLLNRIVMDSQHPLKNTVNTGDLFLPDNLEFPVGHPIDNTLYVVHPYNEKYYIPIDGHEHILFKDRIDEFNNLVQALGATEIKYTRINKKGTNSSRKEDLNIHLKVDGKVNKGALGFNYHDKEDQSLSEAVGYFTGQKFNPKVKPHLPSKLVWYNKETSWQRLFAQRTNGNNLLEVVEEVSSKSLKTVSRQEIININAQLDLLSASINAEIYNEVVLDVQQEFEEIQRIEVVFSPIKDLTTNPAVIEMYQLDDMISYNNKDYQVENLKIDSTVLLSLLNFDNPLQQTKAIEKEKSKSFVLGRNIRIPLRPEYNLYLDMIYVEGGSFIAGTSDADILKISTKNRKRQTSVESFYISKLLVDCKMAFLLLENKYPVEDSNLPFKFNNSKKRNWEVFIKELNELTSLNFTLLSIDEWEYAAKGGVKTKGFKYSGGNNLTDVGISLATKTYLTHPVGSRLPNELEIFDMSGNLYERVLDPNFTYNVKGGMWSSSEIYCRPSFTFWDVKSINTVLNGGFALRLKLSVKQVQELLVVNDIDTVFTLKVNK
ncbi:formylglycine-generating enzyme family protein [Myroides odoratus]|uniref:Gliding motility-associated lipoprotein GldK n=1 Tax=Myroides odoratus TaxID=256 RepID=A0A378RIN5_MYROD|nr:SUMF1/EgtB/PvdO family nonheme iron enzyme [Myroides odoratus]QQU02186.1 SUMF1/EgtB/PvdO family nonheme iron enzyme [Myroides odoratus]STZ26906.1 gliding motility-associated lipoprotein GldK [Myroides odoratus]